MALVKLIFFLILNVIFFYIHLLAFVAGFILLFVTIPLHLSFIGWALNKSG